MKTARPVIARGRPRSFDAAQALDAALIVFWKNGYEGASLSALTRTMGINRPSLYAAFGNKESLFRKALDRYVESTGELVRQALAQPTSRGVVEFLLKGAITKPKRGGIRGCLLVQGALACGDSGDPIRRELAVRRTVTEKALRGRFERAVAEGDLPRSANPATLAKYAVTLLHGIAVQLAGGAVRNELLAAVDLALHAWPGGKSAHDFPN